MKATFVESMAFTESVSEYLTDESYACLQHLLMMQPHRGDVVRGCGGLRKVRFADPHRQKGKRGGIRVFYLYVPEVGKFYLLDIYGKAEKLDLSADEKQQLAVLVRALRKQAIASELRSRKKQ